MPRGLITQMHLNIREPGLNIREPGLNYERFVYDRTAFSGETIKVDKAK